MTGERLAFERLELRRLPGLERGGFTLEGLSAGVTVIHGPNASGKSTTGRAVEQLLWPERGAGQLRRLHGVLRIGPEEKDGGRWEVELDHDRWDWWREGAAADPPALPPAHHADRYGLALHDLLAVDGGGSGPDGGFARRIAEEAAGGFDLAAARDRVGAKERPTRPAKAVDEHKRAREAVIEIEQEQRRLEADAETLAELREERGEARAAAQRLVAVRAAVRWHEAKALLDEERRRLAQLPPELERLSGNELEELDRLERAVAEAGTDLESLREAAAAARRRRAEAGLPDDGIPEETLGLLRRWTDRLTETERELSAERRELTRADERRARARSALGDAAAGEGTDERLEELDPSGWERLLRLARRTETHRAETHRLREMERWLGGAQAPADLDPLRDGVRRLRRWLAVPVSGWRAHGPSILGGLLWIALGAAVVAGAVALPPDWPELLPVAALAVGGGILLWAWLDRRASVRRRRDLAAEDEQARLAQAGLARGDVEPPSRWTEPAVRTALGERERLLDVRRLEAEKAALRPGLEEERRELERRAAELDAERAGALAALGAAPVLLGDDVDPAPLAAFAEALGQWRRAHLEVVERTAACTGLEHQREHLVAELDAGLESVGLGPVRDGDEAASVVEALGRRAEEHRRATDELFRLTGGEGAEGVGGGRVAAAEERLEQRRRDVAELFRRAGLEPGDRAGLGRLLDLHPEYRELARRIEQLGGRVEGLTEELPDGVDGEALRAADPDDLATERDRLDGIAGQERELNDRIVELETLVGEAERGDRLQVALAELGEAEAALRAAREEEADALVAWELAAWVRRSIARRHQPAVLRATRDLFGRFTRGRYELLDPEGDPPELRARETETGRVRRLRELSAGTRVQLLLAVRLAFVEHQERGPRLPLVLDETLANADEWAAEAVIDTLLQVSRSGRQVIYLTAQHDEVAKWRAALEGHDDAPPWTVIDLERVRRGAEAAERPWTAIERAVPSVPPPDGMDRDEYARVLDVPGIDPRREVGALHLWYLVDEPEVLHGLLAEGYEHWGQLEGLLETAGARAVETLLAGAGEGDAAGRERRLRAAARARCLDALFAAWRQGRGTPLDRGVLRASGVVSAERFLDPLSELAGDLDGDAAAFMAALRERSDERTKGFRREKEKELERYLVEEGHVDERPRLERRALEQRAEEAAGDDLAAGRLTAAEIREMVARLPGLEEGPRGD